MSKILVTGGLGFIGNNLVSLLLEKRTHDIRVFDIDTPDKAIAYNIRDVDFHQGDLRNASALREAVEGMDAVIHLAAHTRVMDSIEDPRLNFETNAVGTFNLLSMMRELGVGYLINASTGGAILGDAKPPVHEDMPARPLAPYGASKLAAEGYCSAFMGAYGLKTVSLRFSNIYGPYSGFKGSVIPLFMRQVLRGETLRIYGDGEQTRDFLFAPDLACGIVQALEQQVTGIFQLGTGKGTTVNHILNLLRELNGAFKGGVEYLPFRDAEVLHNVCDITKARQAFFYSPATAVDDGVRQTWDWFVASAKTRTAA